MRNRTWKGIVFAWIIAGVAIPITAQSVGGGISVFVPLSMFQAEEGSVGFETAFETSLGLGKLLSLPLGVAYNQVWGLEPAGTLTDGTTDLVTSGPWFYSDSLLTYLMLKAHVPVGPLYLELFGGGALNWNIALRPLDGRMASDLREAGVIGSGGTATAVDNLEITEGSVGWGWTGGAGLGVQVGQISVDLNATYRHIFHNLTLEGDWFDNTGGTGSFNTSTGFEDFTVLLQGFSIGISGSYAM